MKKFLCLLLLVCSQQLIAQPAKICVMGSSTAVGHFTLNGVTLYPRDSAWTYRLKNHYQATGAIDTLYNIAASGNSPYHGMPSNYVPPQGRSLPYYPFNVTRALQYFPRPAALIVSYPSNQYDYLSKAEIIYCLQTIKEHANAVGIPCYITTSQPRDNFSLIERMNLKAIRDTIMEVFGPWAIDFYTELANPDDYKIKPAYGLGDGVHLNAAGHALLFQKVLAKNIFQSTVPVKWAGVKAMLTAGNKVALQWNTTQEQHSLHFTILKSSNGQSFLPIGSLPAMGNSNSLHNYRFIDTTQATGTQYYKLEMQDASGQKQLSATVSIHIPGAAFTAQAVYPNPVDQWLKVSLYAKEKTTVQISLHSADGKLVFSQKQLIHLQTVFTKNCSKLPAGSYLLLISSRKGSVKQSILKR